LERRKQSWCNSENLNKGGAKLEQNDAHYLALQPLPPPPAPLESDSRLTARDQPTDNSNSKADSWINRN
jgi:hypothetical protein